MLEDPTAAKLSFTAFLNEFGGVARWWRELETAGELPLSAAKRYQLCALIYRFLQRETLRGPLPDGAILDDFLAALVSFYRSLGGTPKLAGAFYRKGAAGQLFKSEQPFERFALHIWSRLPGDRRPATEGAMSARLRAVMHHRVDWDRETHARSACRAGPVTLRVIADLALGGVDPGETITVPARLNFDKPRRPEPVSEYWRNRLRDGSVRVVRSKNSTKSR